MPIQGTRTVNINDVDREGPGFSSPGLMRSKTREEMLYETMQPPVIQKHYNIDWRVAAVLCSFILVLLIIGWVSLSPIVQRLWNDDWWFRNIVLVSTRVIVAVIVLWVVSIVWQSISYLAAQIARIAVVYAPGGMPIWLGDIRTGWKRTRPYAMIMGLQRGHLKVQNKIAQRKYPQVTTYSPTAHYESNQSLQGQKIADDAMLSAMLSIPDRVPTFSELLDQGAFNGNNMMLGMGLDE